MIDLDNEDKKVILTISAISSVVATEDGKFLPKVTMFSNYDEITYEFYANIPVETKEEAIALSRVYREQELARVSRSIEAAKKNVMDNLKNPTQTSLKLIRGENMSDLKRYCAACEHEVDADENRIEESVWKWTPEASDIWEAEDCIDMCRECVEDCLHGDEH